MIGLGALTFVERENVIKNPRMYITFEFWKKETPLLRHYSLYKKNTKKVSCISGYAVHKPELLFQAVSPSGSVSAEFRNHRLYNPWADEDGWLQFTRLELRFYPLGVPKVKEKSAFKSLIFLDLRLPQIPLQCNLHRPEHERAVQVHVRVSRKWKTTTRSQRQPT